MRSLLFRPAPQSTPATGRSYWQRRGGAPVGLKPSRSGKGTALPTRADFVIIGGGFAGLTTAIRLAEAEPAAKIVLLEANVVGYGASGRNGGLLSPLPAPIWLVSAPTDPDHRWALRNINERVHAAAGWLSRVAPGGDVLDTALRLEAKGRMTAAGLARVAGIAGAAGIAHTVRPALRGQPLMVDIPSHTVNPYATVRALAGHARKHRVDVREGIAVEAIEEVASGAAIHSTDGQSITAATVIVCTNAYSGSIRLPVKIPAKVVWNFMVTTNPLGPSARALLPAESPFTVELNAAYIFYRVHRNRLVFGGIEKLSGHGADDFAVPPAVLAGLERHLEASFPGAGLQPAETWGGRFHLTTTDLPVIRRMGRNGSIVLNVGYGGTGVALTLVCGTLAAAVARDHRFQHADDKRLYDIIEGTRLPIRGGLRFGALVARDIVYAGLGLRSGRLDNARDQADV